MTQEEQKKFDEDFDELSKVAEKFMQKHCHPHCIIVIQLDGIQLFEGIKAKPLEVVD